MTHPLLAHASAASMPTDAPMRLLQWPLWLAASLLAGCVSLAPDYQTPELPVPQEWPAGSYADSGTRAFAADLQWQQYFTDPVLQHLIAVALDHNRDLRGAMLRVEEARAAFGIQRADRFPAIGLGAQAARARTPENLSPSGQAVVAGEYRAEVGFSNWELDLWGRIRHLETAALENWLATDAARQAVRVLLIAQVADGYLGVRELDERLDIARQTVVSRQESYRIFKRRYEVGAISRLELMQVEALLTQSQSLLAQLERQRAGQLHALAQLIGQDPGPLPSGVPFDQVHVMAELRPGLPSTLLTTRPDIIAAERQLRAAYANIGAARAAYFPRIALTSSVGLASGELNHLFDSGSKAWAFVPTLSLPIFDGGRRDANLALSQVRRDQAINQYDKAVQTAFREVWDALSTRYWLGEDLAAQRRTVAAQAERARLAQLRYDNGSAAYLEVLDAQRDLLTSRQQLVQVRRALLSSQVALYAALGGGAGAAPAAADALPSPVAAHSR